MKYTVTTFEKFLNNLIQLNGELNRTTKKYEEQKARIYQNYHDKWKSIKERVNREIQNNTDDIFKCWEKNTNQIDDQVYSDYLKKHDAMMRLQKCQEQLDDLKKAEETLKDLKYYIAQEKKNHNLAQVDITLSDILSGKVEFFGEAFKGITLASKGLQILRAGKYAEIYELFRKSEELLMNEIIKIKGQGIHNFDELEQECRRANSKNTDEANLAYDKITNVCKSKITQYLDQYQFLDEAYEKEIIRIDKDFIRDKNALKKNFLRQFSPDEMREEYLRILSFEPSYVDYKCVKEMPTDICIADLEYEKRKLSLLKCTEDFISQNYPYMISQEVLRIPYLAEFNADFNYLYEYSESNRSNVIKNACDFGMRLFTMAPPGKINFTFADPVGLGASFAKFTRLVDQDDRTSEIINGKIWSSPSDIENKLKIMTDHISNVTQRCLQGQYENIYQYNKAAEQNAESYQIIMIMDYPEGLTNNSLKLLEQIITSGPKCGVFTVIYKNSDQFAKVEPKVYPLLDAIEKHLQKFEYSYEGRNIFTSASNVQNQKFSWNIKAIPNKIYEDEIIEKLKKGIKHVDRVVISIDKVASKIPDANKSDSTKNGIRIPIGIHGANDVQYLTLGVGGSHHALVAGVAGSGKSSLLHTIILGALSQYKSPDDLRIYLVDFKRGVEFKIYADYVLPVFRVVAIESEREFGFNILKNLDEEQKMRAVLFKRAGVDKIEDYPGKMPRILVIMDEFHELFTGQNDAIARESSIMMERIVRQGRAFGVHLILSSQSYANISGIDKTVYDQMAVRIVLKCSNTDANMLLDNGSEEIDQISIDDPGRAVYNSEAGNREYNSHFRVAYINPNEHKKMLKEISDETISYAKNEDWKKTRILLSNIEDNQFSIFNQFKEYQASQCPNLGRFYIGESFSLVDNLNIELEKKANANLLLLGDDTEKARNIFTFALLSLCINYWIINKKIPEKPFIHILNYKPSRHTFFIDLMKKLSEDDLKPYMNYIAVDNDEKIGQLLYNLDENSYENNEQFLLVFGYQRAEILKSEKLITFDETDTDTESDYDDIFNISNNDNTGNGKSGKAMFRNLLCNGAKKGVHVIMWQDSFEAMEQDEKDVISYFNHRIAFAMSREEYSRAVSVNNIENMNENNAIYYNKIQESERFRPYQRPEESWIDKNICSVLMPKK